MPDIHACDWVQLEDGRVGVVMLVEFWRGQHGADIAIPGHSGRVWRPLDELTRVAAPKRHHVD